MIEKVSNFLEINCWICKQRADFIEKQTLPNNTYTFTGYCNMCYSNIKEDKYG